MQQLDCRIVWDDGGLSSIKIEILCDLPNKPTNTKECLSILLLWQRVVGGTWAVLVTFPCYVGMSGCHGSKAARQQKATRDLASLNFIIRIRVPTDRGSAEAPTLHFHLHVR